MEALQIINRAMEAAEFNYIKKHFVTNLYWELKKQNPDADLAILNTIYITMDGHNFQFIYHANRGEYTAKEF